MHAHQALRHLDAAQGAIAALPAERRARARFWVEVYRAVVYWRLGRAADRQKAVEIGLAAREAAIAAGDAWATHYRATLLIVLWRSMGEQAFGTFLAQAPEDHAYLLGDAPLRELQKAPEMAWTLRILRAEIEMTARPAWAVEQLRELAHELREAGVRKDLRDECVSRLAWHFVELRDFDRATLFVEELPKEESGYLRALIALKREDFAYAAEVAGTLLGGERPRPADVLLRANALEGLARDGDAELRRARLEEARAGYEAAVRAHRSAPPDEQDVRTLAGAFNGMGDCLLGLGRLDAAERAYTDALQALAQADGSWVAQAEVAETYKDQGRLAERRGQPAAALERYLAALDEVEAARRRIPLDRLGIAWLEASLLEAVDGVLRLAARGEAAPLLALATADRMKARGLLDWMTEKPTSADLGAYRRAVHELATARTAAEMRETQQRLEAARATGAGARSARGLSTDALSALLRDFPDTLFLSYWVGKELEDRRCYLVLAGGGGAVQVLDLGPGGRGREVYRGAVQAVGGLGAEAWTALDAAAAFYLPAAARRALAAAGSVVVSVDAAIGELPFEALRAGGTAVGVSHRVYRAPSLAVFERLRRRAPHGGGVLLLDSATPPAAERELHGVSELRFSAAEAGLVARAWPGAVRLHGADAAVAPLRSRLAGGPWALLHISAHALSHPGSPSASLLLLSDVSVDMATLAALPLDGTLVVFSACRSAGGARAGGEGVMGLLWGPFSAGARGVVASHWPVNQQATKDLMGQFHHHLAAGADAGEAMRRARQALLAAPNYASPGYWAGFGIYAVPGATGGGSAAPRVLLALGLGALLSCALVFILRRRAAATPTGAARRRP